MDQYGTSSSCLIDKILPIFIPDIVNWAIKSTHSYFMFQAKLTYLTWTLNATIFNPHSNQIYLQPYLKH